ncbi:two-component system sensor kinase [Constantimarinum furrinae]|uniref:Two-component system sensor kinase n=1 Tax=Constantimarinum furrinae TaxID=2562285 RepID=A0A7G8PTG0_9FLAO|nr:two-component system sensor kinase [Constantimarinum furrinae]
MFTGLKLISKIPVSLLWLCVASTSLFAQPKDDIVKQIDSLLNEGKSRFKTSIDSALLFSSEARLMALKIQDTPVIAKTNVHKAYYLMLGKQPDEALDLLRFNVEHSEYISNELLGETFNTLGAVYALHQERDKAISNYLSAIEAFTHDENNKGLARTYVNIGMVYSALNRNDLSDYFFEKSKFHHSQINNSLSVHNLDEAEGLTTAGAKIDLAEKLLKGLKNEENTRLKAIVYHDLSKGYFEAERYRDAIVAAERSIAIKKQINYESNVDLGYYLIGTSYIELGEYQRAIPNLKKAELYSKKKNLLVNIFEKLIYAYKEQGDFKRAFETSAVYTNLKDSINALQENDRIAAITARFETEKQAAEIELLESDNALKETQLVNQRTILWGSAIGILLLLSVLFFAYKNHKTRQNLQFSELTQKLLLMQLNPHFLFNALNGIQYFIKQNDVKKSTRYISSFSGLMRHILENSVEKFITVKEDYETINDFLALQQLVHNNAFQFTVGIEDGLDAENVGIPPMLTQPFVENAIIHGVNGLDDGKIVVRYRLMEPNVIVEIIDNGQGIHRVRENANSLHKSMGTSITKQRIENLLKTEKFPIELEIISNRDESQQQGTKIVLTFPMKYI